MAELHQQNYINIKHSMCKHSNYVSYEPEIILSEDLCVTRHKKNKPRLSNVVIELKGAVSQILANLGIS